MNKDNFLIDNSLKEAIGDDLLKMLDSSETGDLHRNKFTAHILENLKHGYTEKERMLYMRFSFMLMINDIYNTTGSRQELMELYTFTFGNDKRPLLNTIEQPRIVRECICDQIVADISLALALELKTNTALRHKIVDMFAGRFHNQSVIIEKTLKKMLELRDIENLNERMRSGDHFFTSKDMEQYFKLLENNIAAVQYYIFCSMNEPDKYTSPVMCVEYSRDKWSMMEEAPFTDHIIRGLDGYVKKNADWMESDECFFATSVWEKFLKRRKKELADYYNTSYDNLLGDMMETIYTDSIEYGGRFSTMLLLRSNNVLYEWMLETMEAMNVDTEYVDNIVSHYYMSVFFKHIDKYQNSGHSKPISKLDIIRYMGTDDKEHDYENILQMLETDLIINMYQYLFMHYYDNFSMTGEANLPGVVDSLKNQYRQLEQKHNAQFKRLNEQITILSSRTSSQNNKQESEENLHELELRKQLRRLKEENDSLKNQLSQSQEYISLLEQSLSSEQTFSTNTTFDVEQIKAGRYLFVGSVDIHMKDIYQHFPGSIFMTNEQMNISNLKVDAVIFITRFMSHGMYFKTKNTFAGTEVPLINFNGRNINQLCRTIYKEIYEKLH